MKQCTQCQSSFEVRDQDREFYEAISPTFKGKKYQIPEPTLCPDCRQQRRLAWRNERNLYWTTCDGTDKKILSVFHPDTPFKVYDVDYWYSDAWDAKEYGRDFDFNRPFFEQFEALMKEVPQLSRSVTNNENSEYVNQCGWSRNCYLVFESVENENCMYGNYIGFSKSCMDTFMVNDSELCYECTDCRNCYEVKYSQNSNNCSNSAFLKNCIGVKNSFMCCNLKNKEYYFLNEPLSKEAYEKKMSELNLGNHKVIQQLKKQFQEFCKDFPNKHLVGINNENSTGNYLNNTQNCHQCFDLFDSQNCAYVGYGYHLKNVQDMNVFGNKSVDFCYEVHEVGDGARNLLFTDQSWSDVSNLIYCKLCPKNSQDLFGCVGMKKAQYCILNKQYSKEEYEELVPKIIEHMKSTSEWGEFFPIQLSPFAYNQTITNDYHPHSEQEALSKGWKWANYETKVNADRTIQSNQLPDDIKDIPNDILNWAIVCEVSGKPFKITEQELKFYRQHQIPLPRKHHDERHRDRFKLRNPRHLYDRKCGKCEMQIRTTYSPDHSGLVYCEECYLENLN